MPKLPTKEDSQYESGVGLNPAAPALVLYPGKHEWVAEEIPDEVLQYAKPRPGVFKLPVKGKTKICNVFAISRNAPVTNEALKGTQWAQEALLKEEALLQPVIEDSEASETVVQFQQASMIKIAQKISRS